MFMIYLFYYINCKDSDYLDVSVLFLYAIVC